MRPGFAQCSGRTVPSWHGVLMNSLTAQLQQATRRHFLQSSPLALGAVALATMGGQDAMAAPGVVNPLAEKPSHFPGRAKHVIFIHLVGSPPHLDLWDYKPELVKRTGQDCPDEFIKGKKFAFTSGMPKLLGTPRTFAKYGQGGVQLSDAVPNLHGVADELCVINSMFTEQFNHAPAELLLYTGSRGRVVHVWDRG